MQASRAEAALAGSQFAISQAQAAGLRPPKPTVGAYPPASVATVLREIWSGPDPYTRIVDRLETHIRDGARQATMFLAVDLADALEDEAREQALTSDEEESVSGSVRRVGWARVLRGDSNCAFCVMLASRGPVFSSAEAAGRRSAKEKWLDATGWTNSYHDNCDCAVVLVTDAETWPGWYQVRALEKLYEDARKAAKAAGRKSSGKNYRENQVLREIDRILRERADAGRPVEIPEFAA